MTKVYPRLEELARRHGAHLEDSELIGLIPQDAYEPGAEWIARIPNFDPEQKVLERRLERPLEWERA
jgi:glutamate formiminotransferase